jgi:arylsulfatase
MNFRPIAMLVVAASCLLSSLPSSPAAAEKAGPNILLILTDNTGWGDWGAYGGGALRGAPSPRIDALASQGMLLQNFNTEPQCTPSRAALMTGRYAVRSGAQSVPIGTPLYGLVPWEITIAEALSGAGYATAAFGKWHLGRTTGRWPTDQGFDEWYGIPNSTDEAIWITPSALARLSTPADVELADSDKPWIMESRRSGKPKQVKPYDLDERRKIDLELTRRTVDFMKRSVKQGRPFFAYVPLTATHYPTLPHPDFAGKSGHGDYTDMLMQTDHYVGQMLDALEKLGIEDETLVIFTADNGPEHPDNGDGQYSGWTGPWAGTYFTAMEGGLRAPFIARWPGKVPAARVSNEIVHIIDLFPTLAAIGGAEVPRDRALDGVDMSEFFFGKRAQSGREGFIIFVGDDLRGMKWRNWKWHRAWQETKYDPVQEFSTVPKIVNLIRDPREQRQVAEPYNTWIQYPFTQLLVEYQGSVKRHPNVPMGAPDSYAPAVR